MIDDFLRIKVGTMHTAFDNGNQSQGLTKLLSGTFYTFDATVTDVELAKRIGYDIRGYLKFNKKKDGRYEYVAFIYAPTQAKMLKCWANNDTIFHSIELVAYGILMSYVRGATTVKDILATRRKQRTKKPVLDNLLHIPMSDEPFGNDRVA
ncbi:hypothetical protein HYU06_03245 [Candidatus Woesearchaeota archaeon]|nr:hypothetical protein [Candidatus Woesearchaeota archaeon]